MSKKLRMFYPLRLKLRFRYALDERHVPTRIEDNLRESVWRNSSGEINALFLDTILTTTTVLFVRDDDE